MDEQPGLKVDDLIVYVTGTGIFFGTGFGFTFATVLMTDLY